MSKTHWHKYPRTRHLPNSPGASSDDKIAPDLAAFDGAEVVVTEKMDGENTSLYADGHHARSLDSGYHPARSHLAALQGQIGHLIAPGWRICGENLYARHALAYANLPAYFLAFSVWDDTNTCLSWDDTLHHIQRLGLHPVPTLYRGPFSKALPEQIASSLNTDTQEGFVIRLASSFPYETFSQSVVKWVRAGHVETDQHWSKAPLTANALAPQEQIA